MNYSWQARSKKVWRSRRFGWCCFWVSECSLQHKVLSHLENVALFIINYVVIAWILVKLRFNFTCVIQVQQNRTRLTLCWKWSEVNCYGKICCHCMFCNVLTFVKKAGPHIAFLTKVQSQVGPVWTQLVCVTPVQSEPKPIWSLLVWTHVTTNENAHSKQVIVNTTYSTPRPPLCSISR